MRACSCDISKINTKKEEEARRMSYIVDKVKIRKEFDKVFEKVDKMIAKNIEFKKENEKPSSVNRL